MCIKLVYQGNPDDLIKQKKLEKVQIYNNAVIRLLENLHDYENEPRVLLKKSVLLLVKQFALIYEIDRQYARSYDVSSKIITCLSMITPKELMDLFPIDKTQYSDDYQATLSHIQKYDMNVSMSDKTEEILSEYMNKDIRRVFISYMVSCLHGYEEETGESPLLDFFKEQGVEIFSKKNSLFVGNQGTVISCTQKKPKKRIPAYMRLVQ